MERSGETMILEYLYPNFGLASSEDQLAYVTSYRFRRSQDLAKTPPSRRRSSSASRSKIDLSLTEEEKRVMKLLGLKKKDIITLRDFMTEPEESSDDVKLLLDPTYEEEEE
jgi:hypothetical protein